MPASQFATENIVLLLISGFFMAIDSLQLLQFPFKPDTR
ncbi:hypothetical protein VCRA213O314_950002 [Vibrio crassostreae]|nr:hypothetical protein VCRA213O314_950002 [Vibrio crassostreae]